MNSNNCTFIAKTVEAHTIKAISEVLQNILTDVCFRFDKKGMKLLTIDNKTPTTLLVNLELKAKSFDDYHCPKPISVGLNLQHLYKMLKSTKKRDTIIFFIKKNEPGLLGITTLQPETAQKVTSKIKIQNLSEIDVELPDGYNHPIHIATGTYQKMCKDMQSISNQITLYAKGSFLKFVCEVEGMYNREVPFGDEDEDNDELDPYEETFHTKSLSQLIKVSGLNNRMAVYTPPPKHKDHIPLRITIETGHLGKLTIYLKSIQQIQNVAADYDE